jgi:hypothetical protein
VCTEENSSSVKHTQLQTPSNVSPRASSKYTLRATVPYEETDNLGPFLAVLRIRIRIQIRMIRMFLGLPDPLSQRYRSEDPDPYPDKYRNVTDSQHCFLGKLACSLYISEVRMLACRLAWIIVRLSYKKTIFCGFSSLSSPTGLHRGRARRWESGRDS